MPNPVIVAAVRTPFGRYGGAYRETMPSSFLAQTLCGVAERAGMVPAKVDEIIVGAVTQTTEQSFNIARLAALEAGFSVEVPAVTINRACSSSQQAVHFIAQGILAGDIEFGIAAGVEHMTRVPMFSDVDPEGKFKGCWGMLSPELLRRHPLVVQGESAELLAEKYGITRAQLDSYSSHSHRKAFAAAQEGNNRELLLPAFGVDKEGNCIELTQDEGIRAAVNMEKMSMLPTVFRPEGNGVVTAANSSQLADGASAVLVADKNAALREGLTPRAAIKARIAVAVDPVLQLGGVIPATLKALDLAGLDIGDIDWIEINEAFASVVLAWASVIKPEMDNVNPWGGAVAHGHPLGATGTGLMAKMMAGLEHKDGQFGLQVVCAAHGLATATIIERI